MGYNYWFEMSSFSEFKNEKGEIDIEGIKKIVPYDKTFLFMDKVLSLSNDKIIAVKELSGKEEFFKFHFVGFPLMPGALTVEGLGQASTLLVRANIQNNTQDHHSKDILAYKLKDVKFMFPILPGDEMRYEIDLISQDERIALLRGKVFVKDKLAVEALLMLAIVDRAEFRAKCTSKE